MGAIKELLDKQPYSRAFLWVLLIIVVVVFRTCQVVGREESTRGKFQSVIDERIERVTQSVHTLKVADAQLLACIRRAALDRAGIHPMNTGGIDDVGELQLLSCRGNGITDLSGIGLLSRLTFFDISNNSIQSLSPLRDHPHLQNLHAQENPLHEIRVLRTMPSLEEVYLPDLPGQACADVERQVKGLKSNFPSIKCAGKDKKQMAGKVRNSTTTRNSRKDRSDELTDSEHQALLKYEQNRRYENR